MNIILQILKMFKYGKQIENDWQTLLNWPKKPVTDDQLETLEDYFYSWIDSQFKGHQWTNLAEDIIQFQNFHPYFVGKDIGSGRWIKIKTESGYNVYWAKHSNKELSAEYFYKKFKNINQNSIKRHLNNKDIDKAKNSIDKSKEIQDWAEVAEILSLFPTNIKYAKYLKTRTQWEYVLPYQYEVVSDIQLYVDAIQDDMNKNSVKYKMLFTKQDEDQIFYLQSRGISKDIAIMMCKLQQCYFKVDTNALFAEVYQQKKS